MEHAEKQKIKELLKKSQYIKGRPLTKPERMEILEGYLKLKMLGIYEKPKFIEEARKEWR